jgi:hypothetical protein
VKGCCAPNDKRPFTREELETIRIGRFDSVKLFWYHDLDNVRQLQRLHAPADPSRLLPAYNGPQHFLGRLPDLAPGEDLEPYTDKCWLAIRDLRPVCNIWQTFNEPNLPEAVGGWGAHAWEFQFYMRENLRTLKQRAFEHGFEFYTALGPLCYAPDYWHELNIWRTALTTRPDKDQLTPALHEYHNYACANTYWQYPGRMLDGSYGMNWQDVQNWTGLPVIVAEWGYTGYTLTADWTERPKTTMKEVHSTMAEQYPAYAAEIKRRGAVGSYVFQVGGTADWRGLAIPLHVAAKLGEVQTA